MFFLPATIVKAAEHAATVAAEAHGGETGLAAMMADKFEQLNHVLAHLAPIPKIHIGPITITSTILNTWLLAALVIGGCYLLTRNLEFVPRKTGQKVLEMAVEFIGSLTETVIGPKGREYIPFVGTIFVFILVCNLAWFIPGMLPPTTDMNTTFGFAICAIIFVNYYGIKANGFRHYIKHFYNPLILMEQFTHAFSLGIRLFGNMFGEKMVATVLAILVPLIFPLPVQILGIIMGFIQAFVFTLLTITYIADFVVGH
ncbi:MAG: F0F1 ATP synthase subunit A [Firmicutes bacterium]|nr:F0F1 ATP synthase subunit A [Bacillota bacterium]